MSDGKEMSAEPPIESEPNDTAVGTVEKPAPPVTRLLPPFKVLLHNDDVNEIDSVVLAIFKLTPLSLEEAVQKTLEAHQAGVALLVVTHLERAELYCEQFATFKLTVTAEPA